MNTPEELRVVEALKALAGGLPVTEQDIITGGARLRSNLEPPKPTRRLAVVAAAAVAVLIAGVTAAVVADRNHAAPPVDQGPPTPAEMLAATLQSDAYDGSEAEFLAGEVPTRESLAGLWLSRRGYDHADRFLTLSYNMFIERDGDWYFGHVEEPFDSGTSRLVGDTWTRRTTSESSGSCTGESYPWRASLADDGSLHLAFLGTRVAVPATPAPGPATNTCGAAFEREVWDPVGPGSPLADFWLASAADVVWQTREDWSSSDAASVYVAPGTGYVLSIFDDGSYAYYDDLVTGQLVPSCSGELLSGSVEVAQTPQVPGYFADAQVLRFSTTEAGCASAVAGQGLWVRLDSSVE